MRALFAALLLCTLALPAGAAVHTVGDGQTYATIQLGVTACDAGDTVIVYPGSYVESVETAGENSITILGSTSTPSDVLWFPDGTTSGTNNMSLYFNFSYTGPLKVANVQFIGIGTSDHVGIRHTDSDGDLTVENCNFVNLRCGIWRAAGAATADLTVTNCSFSSMQSGAPVNFVRGVDTNAYTDVTIEGCTFDFTGLTTPGSSSVVRFQSLAASGTRVLRNSSFVADYHDGTDLANGFVYFGTNPHVGVLLEGNTFSGGGATQVGLGNTATAAVFTDGVVIRGNTFTNISERGIDVRKAVGSTGAQFHRNLAIWGNKFYGSGGTATEDTGFGIHMVGVTRASVIGNDCYDMAKFGGISLTSCRFTTASGNRLYRCDNGLVIAAADRVTNIYQYGVSFVGNYFEGDGDDGAIKIDEYDETDTASVPNDSLLTIGNNVFTNVTYVGAWVEDDASGQTNYATVATWQAYLVTNAGTMLDGTGSVVLPDGSAAARAAGIGARGGRTLGSATGLTR